MTTIAEAGSGAQGQPASGWRRQANRLPRTACRRRLSLAGAGRAGPGLAGRAGGRTHPAAGDHRRRARRRTACRVGRRLGGRADRRAAGAREASRAVVHRARALDRGVGGRDRQARSAAAAVLPLAAGLRRGLHGRLAETGRQPARLALAAAARLCHRRRGGLCRRRGPRLVQARRLLDPSGDAPGRAAARDGLAAARLLHLSDERQRQHLPDRAGDGLPGHRAHLVRCRGRADRLLRRGTHAWGRFALPDPQGRDSRRPAACLRRPVHGAGLLVRRARGRRDAGREVGPGLVPAMGPGLGPPTPTCTARCWSWR